MNRRRLVLLERKLELVQRSQALRDRLAQHAVALAPAAAVADGVWQGARWVRAHPWAPVAFAAGLWLVKPRWAWRLALRGWTVWQWVKRARRAAPKARTWWSVVSWLRR